MSAPDKFDASNKYGATVLADVVMIYWAQRGFGNVVARRYEVREGTWGIQSNLVNGLPPVHAGRRI